MKPLTQSNGERHASANGGSTVAHDAPCGRLAGSPGDERLAGKGAGRLDVRGPQIDRSASDATIGQSQKLTRHADTLASANIGSEYEERV